MKAIRVPVGILVVFGLQAAADAQHRVTINPTLTTITHITRSVIVTVTFDRFRKITHAIHIE